MKHVLRLIVLTCALSASLVYGAVTVTVNGSNHTIPQTNEKGWGTNVTAWIQAISQFTLQNSGGTFTLTAETYTGPTYGFKVPYIKTATSTPSTAGVLRLAVSDSIGWRNNANGANLLLAVDGSDNLTFNGVAINTPVTATAQDSTFRIYDNGDATKKIAFEASGITTATTRTITMPDAAVDLGVLTAATSSNTNSAVVRRDGSGNFSAGTITAALTGNASTATALAADPADCSANNYATAINASGTLTCGQVNAALGLSGIAPVANGGTGLATLTNHSLQVGAATANVTQLAVGSTGTILTGASASDPTFSAAPVLGASGTIGTLGMSGNTSGVVTIKPQATAGTYNFNLPITSGNSGDVLTSGGGGANAMTWSTPLVNPMSTGADIIYGGASGVATRLANGTSGQVLTSSGGTSAPTWSIPPTYNFIVNGAFDYWQAGTSATDTATGGATPTATYLYQADQWYVNNILGGGTVEGIITYSQVTGVTNGSKFGASVKITTAPTGTGIQNGTEFYTVLSNKASLPLYGQTASFTVLVKALGNVNQVGCQFYYATTEAKPTNAIGSEQTASVSTGGFTSCTISAQALGTSQTVSGVIGVRIRITTVSSGNAYDLNNGFVVEQAMLNLGSTAASFQRQYNDPVQEQAACQYFYEKSYAIATAPASATILGMSIFNFSVTAAHLAATVNFKVEKRAVPTISTWDSAGTGSRQTLWSAGGWAKSDSINLETSANRIIGTTAATFDITSIPTPGNNYGWHWVADARI